MTNLADVDEAIRDDLDDGTRCPTCTQYAKVYRRRLTAGVARVLIAMHHTAGEEWVSVNHLRVAQPGNATGHADLAKARYWGLIEGQTGERPDGSNRVGWWRLTPHGTAFVRAQTRVPKYARIYDGQLISLDDTEAVDIRDTLGTRFNYTELMSA